MILVSHSFPPSPHTIDHPRIPHLSPSTSPVQACPLMSALMSLQFFIGAAFLFPVHSSENISETRSRRDRTDLARCCQHQPSQITPLSPEPTGRTPTTKRGDSHCAHTGAMHASIPEQVHMEFSDIISAVQASFHCSTVRSIKA